MTHLRNEPTNHHLSRKRFKTQKHAISQVPTAVCILQAMPAGQSSLLWTCPVRPFSIDRLLQCCEVLPCTQIARKMESQANQHLFRLYILDPPFMFPKLWQRKCQLAAFREQDLVVAPYFREAQHSCLRSSLMRDADNLQRHKARFMGPWQMKQLPSVAVDGQTLNLGVSEHGRLNLQIMILSRKMTINQWIERHLRQPLLRMLRIKISHDIPW